MTQVFLFLKKNGNIKNLIAVPCTVNNMQSKRLRVFLEKSTNKIKKNEKIVKYQCYSLNTNKLPDNFLFKEKYIICPDKKYPISTETYWGNCFDEHYMITDLENLYKNEGTVTYSVTLNNRKSANETWLLAKFLYDNIEQFEYDVFIKVKEFLSQTEKNNYPDVIKLNKKSKELYDELLFYKINLLD